MSDFELALAHYRKTFPNLAALGPAPAYHVWEAEYQRLSVAGFEATLVTQVGSEAGTTTAARNFEQKVLLQALHTVRGELDPEYAKLVFRAPALPARVNLGITLKVGY